MKIFKESILSSRARVKEVFRSLLPFGIGALGMLGGYAVGLPLPPLMGPMLTNAGCAIAGWSMRLSHKFMPPIFLIVGWYLGSRATPEILQSMAQWWPAVILVVIWTVLTALIGFCYFVFVARFDKQSAIFASLPGALANIVAFIGNSVPDQRRIIVPQVVRVFFMVGLLPAVFSFFLPPTDLLSSEGVSFSLRRFELLDWGLCGFLTFVLATAFRYLRVPSPEFLAGVIASGFFYATGLITEPFPNFLIIAAFFLLGCLIGGRFTGTPLRLVLSLGKHGVAVSFLMLLFCIPGAFLTLLWVDVPSFSSVLAYIPGAIHEMSIIAAAYDLEPLFVASMHFVRVVFIVLSLPFLLKFFSNSK